MDPNDFWSSCGGDRVAYYSMKRLWACELLYVVTKVVPQTRHLIQEWMHHREARCRQVEKPRVPLHLGLKEPSA